MLFYNIFELSLTGFFLHQEAIFRTLAAILHLGNIEFSPGKEHDSSVIKDKKSTFHLQMAAELLMYVTYLDYIIVFLNTLSVSSYCRFVLLIFNFT